jgi:hypothetical protein
MKVQFKGAPHLTEYHGLVDGAELHLSRGGFADVSDEAGAILVADFPGIFVMVEERKTNTTPLLQAMDSAPADRQIREGKPRGGRKGAAGR